MSENKDPYTHKYEGYFHNHIGITCPNCGEYTRNVESDGYGYHEWFCVGCNTHWTQAQLYTWMIDSILDLKKELEKIKK